VDPRSIQDDLATLYIHGNNKPPQFVCQNVNAQIRLDFIMAGLMTVLALETRKAAGPEAILARHMGLQLAPY